MWTTDDLSEGDYIVFRDKDDRKRMFLGLRKEEIYEVSDTKLLRDKYRPVLRVMSLPNHKGYESVNYYGREKSDAQKP